MIRGTIIRKDQTTALNSVEVGQLTTTFDLLINKNNERINLSVTENKPSGQIVGYIGNQPADVIGALAMDNDETSSNIIQAQWQIMGESPSLKLAFSKTDLTKAEFEASDAIAQNIEKILGNSELKLEKH